MPSFYGPGGPSELLPRSVFLKPLVAGRRVLELGAVAATGGSTAVALIRLGARTVTAFDVDAAAVERARGEHRGSGVSFRSGKFEELPERSFDLVLVEDAARAADPRGASALGRLLAPTGHLVVPVRNPEGPSAAGLAGDPAPEGPGWAATVEALRPFFPSIEVATQQLLLGYVLAPVTGRPATLDVDASAAQVPAAYWLLVCGQEPAGLADQALVALPPDPLFELRGPQALDVARRRAEALEAELRRSRERIDELRRAADVAAEGVRERESWVDGLRHEVEGRHESESKIQAELQVARARLVRLEREHAEAAEGWKRVREQLTARSRELAGARQAVTERTEDLRLAEEELERLRRQVHELRMAQAGAPVADGVAIGERITLLEAELAAARTARDEAHLERDQALAARDQAAEARDRAIADRDRAAQERDLAATERDERTSDRDRAVRERDGAIADRDEALAWAAALEERLSPAGAPADDGTLAALRERNAALEAALAAAEVRAAEERQGADVATEALEAVGARLAELDETATALVSVESGALDALAIAPPNEVVASDVDSLQAELRQLRAALEDRERQLDHARRELAAGADRFDRLVSELAELKSRLPAGT